MDPSGYTVYDKTFEGENFRGFRGFDSTANVFPRIFPSKFFSNNIASSSSLFLVVQIMVYKEYRNTGKGRKHRVKVLYK